MFIGHFAPALIVAARPKAAGLADLGRVDPGPNQHDDLAVAVDVERVGLGRRARIGQSSMP